ncbi:MAG TPA: undecaprenyldiphospho-muramoylpentapeptide beta-N-acetylglucosaminyltransferase [Ilumatobacteraceae bacterium]
MEGSTFAVITGGGTSGHVLPALAIADALVAAGHRGDEIVYVGAQRGIETRLLPPTPYAHHFLDVVGLQRRLTPRNIVFPIKLVRAVGRARRLLKQLRPAVVVSVGGYASFPATFAARLLRIPVVVVSYDRIPGLASRVSARFATACAVAFEGSTLPRARYTGAPVRLALTQMDRPAQRAEARAALGIPGDRFVVAAFGGSLGSKVLNTAVSDMVDLLADRADIAVRHVVGDRFLGQAAAERTGAQGIMYTVIGYEDQMLRVYAASDLMVTRAGASTIAELATTGMPAVIVPWPDAADDHQTDNARILGEVNAAVVVPEAEISGARLAELVTGFAADPESLAEVAAAAYAAGAGHRSGRLVALVEEVAAR